eukprot:jgi/Tetstr1/459274/TSEL_004674.t1
MAPKKNEPAKDKEDKDDATPGPSQVPETKPEPEIEHTEPEPEPEPTRLDPEPEAELETPAPTTGHASGSGASGSRAPIAEAPRMVPEFLSMCTDEEVFGTEEEQRQRAAEKRKQALDITGTPGPERKTKLMTGPLLACIGKIKDVELDSAGNYESYYAWTLVERNVLAQALTGFASGEIDIDDLANIDKDFKNALPYVNTLAVPPALNGFNNTGAVDWISYGHLRVEIADPEVKTSHGGDINTLYADIVNLVVDKDTGLPHIFSFISDKFVAPPPEFEFRSPKLQDCSMVAQSYKRNPSLSAENFSVSFPVVHKNRDCFSEEYEPLALTMANFKELVAAHEGGENPRLADSSSYKPEIDVIIEFLSAYGARQANIDGSHRREAKRMVKENYPEIYKANKGIHLTSAKMYIGLSPEVCRYMSMKLNEAGHTVVGDTSMHKLLVSDPFS